MIQQADEQTGELDKEKHADSLVDIEEATVLMAEEARRISAAIAAGTPYPAPRRRAAEFGGQEVLQYWQWDTPDGPIHRVAILRWLDGEHLGLDFCYRDEADAIAVWEDHARPYVKPTSAYFAVGSTISSSP